jgi:outer membrane receptor protein involved in Fe transport
MLLALILSLSLGAADPAVNGIVKDTNGAAVAGAAVIVRSDAGEEQTVTGPDGHFSLDKAPSGAATITVRAVGFVVKEEPLTSQRETLEILLSPAGPRNEIVTVTAARTEQQLGNTPASVTILDSDKIKESPAVVTDDVLRQIPSFSLFTRASSLSSHPTSQGVSLRGIGPSGVSRTLVMSDGIPVNDPFGGWVYWTRFPVNSIDRVEVVEGANSSLYGNYAMGGIINILSQPPARRTIEVKPQYGNLRSPKVDFFGADVWGKLAVTAEGSGFDTNGFPIVAGVEKGTVDDKSSVTFGTGDVKLQYAPNNHVSTSIRTGYFHESRNNGKHSTTDCSPAPCTGTEEHNNTRWGFVSGSVRLDLPSGNLVQASVFTNNEHFFSDFLAVQSPGNVARSLGRMTLNQTVPAKDVGASALWSRAFGAMNYVSVGTDWHWVDGDSQEDSLDTTTGTNVTQHRVSGGTQQSLGAYFQDIITPLPNLTITLAARIDHFRDYDAHNLENAVSGGVIGAPTAFNNPAINGRTDTVGTPRAAAIYRLTDAVSVWGDVNTGFRAPTLNELYRQFRKGTTLTLPNYQLVPERLTGYEGGVNVSVARGMNVRVTAFDNKVRNPVTNVTMTSAFVPIPADPSLPVPANAYPTTASCTPAAATVCVLRQNVGRTEIKGLQTEFEARYKDLRFTASYMRDSAKVIENAANPALVGNYLPQVPQNRGSLTLSYTNPTIGTIAADWVGVGRQFDDDLNGTGPGPAAATPNIGTAGHLTDAALAEAGYAAGFLGLPGYSATDLMASHSFGKNFEVFFGVQNVFNKEYFVATAPSTIGSPRLYNFGARIRWSGR